MDCRSESSPARGARACAGRSTLPIVAGESPFFGLFPILALGVAQQPGHLWAGHSLGHQQHTTEAVVIPRFLRASDLILQSKNDACSVSQAKRSHSSRRTYSAWHAAITYDVMFRNT